MTVWEFRDQLVRRFEEVGVPTPNAVVLDRLGQYFELLARWNARINLTALSLTPPANQAFDRLLIEPVAAAIHLSQEIDWVDLGSGGGSPAIPMKVVNRSARLTMIESKARKAAFLRETVRTLGLDDCHVANQRFEELDSQSWSSADVVTVRAVRTDDELLAFVARLLRSDGVLLLFRTDDNPLHSSRFEHVRTVQLLVGAQSFLGVYRKMFHVEHRG